MSFLSRRTHELHSQLVRIEGNVPASRVEDGPSVALLRFDNYDASSDTYTGMGDVAAFRSPDDPNNGRMRIRAYQAGDPVDALSVTGEGYVGVGTNSPRSTLDVVGTLTTKNLSVEELVTILHARIGNAASSHGVDVDVAGDVRCRTILAQRLISSAFSGSPIPVPLPVAFPGVGSGASSDVSVSGNDTCGVISIVFSEDAAEREHTRVRTKGSSTVVLACVNFGQPLPAAVRLIACDEASASIGSEVYGAPTMVGFDVVVSRAALTRFASGSLYRWAFVSAPIPRPPFPSHPVRGVLQNDDPPAFVRIGEDIKPGGAVRLLGTDSVGVVRIMFGAHLPEKRNEPFGTSHVASIDFYKEYTSAQAVVIVAPWSERAIEASVGAGVRRKPGSAAALLRADGSGFELMISSVDDRDLVPYGVYAWSYMVLRTDDSAPSSPSDQAKAEPLMPTGPGATASVQIVRPGAGIISLLTGDPPPSELGSEPILALIDIKWIPDIGSGTPVVLSPANAAAASLSRPLSAIPHSLAGFAVCTMASPPQAPLWPHTRYTWFFAAVGMSRHLPTTPTIWYGTALGSGGGVRIRGTDTAGTIEAFFGPNSAPFARLASLASARAARWWPKARGVSTRPAHIASVIFSVRYDNPVSVQLTASRCPESATEPSPSLIACVRQGGSAFDLFLSSRERGRLQPFVVYSWSYVVIAASTTQH